MANRRRYQDGDVIGAWTIIGYAADSHRFAKYICRCACGARRQMSPDDIVRIKSCRQCHLTYIRMTAKQTETVVLEADRVRPDEIRKAVSQHFQVGEAELVSQRRPRTIARPRMMAMALTRDLTKLSTTLIGRRYGDRDHTTVLNAVRRIAELRKSDPVLDEDYIALKSQLTELRA